MLCSLCWAELPSACPALSMPHGGCAKPAANICILLPFHFGATSIAGGWGSMLPRGAAVATTGRASYAHASKCVNTALACAKKKVTPNLLKSYLKSSKLRQQLRKRLGAEAPKQTKGAPLFLFVLQNYRQAAVLEYWVGGSPASRPSPLA